MLRMTVHINRRRRKRTISVDSCQSAKALIDRISSSLKGIFGGFRETAYTYLTKG
jgi:hypothetical protein